MCIYQQEVDALNEKFSWGYIKSGYCSYLSKKIWYTQGGEDLIDVRDNQWHIYNQGTGICTTHTSLEEAWEKHCKEVQLIEYADIV